MKILFCLLILSPSLFAQDFAYDKEKGKAVPTFIGEPKLLKGQVQKEADGKSVNLKMDSRFYKNDTIITGDKSLAKNMMVDDTLITLNGNSRINFAEFKFQDKTDRQALFKFIQGQLRGEVINKAKTGDIQFKTQYTVMGVRGTTFFINQHKNKNLAITEFALSSGEIEVSDEKNQKHELKPKDHLVLIHDEVKNKSASEKFLLTDEQFESLKDEKAFLPYMVPEEVAMTSSLYSVINNKAEEASMETQASPENETDKIDKTKNWRYNLKKLNQQLKENHNNRHKN